MISVLTGSSPIHITPDIYTFTDVENHQVTDGYHTMQELYDVRLALCVNLFNAMSLTDEGRLMGCSSVVKSKLHNDGTMFDGYFVIAAFLDNRQISFHYELKHWDRFQIPEVERVPWEYDGHTTQDVIQRLME